MKIYWCLSKNVAFIGFFWAKSNAYLFSISDFFFNELKVNVNCVVMQVEDECKLSSVDEIATAVHQMLGRIQEEPLLN